MDAEKRYEEQDFRQTHDLVRTRQYISRPPRKASDVVAHLLARRGYSQQQAVSQLQQAWDSTVSEAWREQTQAGNLRRGVLEVFVQTSALLQRLEFDKRRLLDELKQKLKPTNLKDIRFRIGEISRHE